MTAMQSSRHLTFYLMSLLDKVGSCCVAVVSSVMPLPVYTGQSHNVSTGPHTS